jgi:hypothetical protein
MTKIIIPSLLTMAFSVAGFSQTIMRTAEINLNNSPATSLGTYTIEVQIEKNQQGAGIDSKVELATYGDADIPGHGFYACEETLTIQGDVKMTYTLKNAAGKAIGRQTVAPTLTARASKKADADSVCKAQFPSRVEANFFKADEFVNFKTADGILSVSARFTADVVSDESFNVSVNEASLVQLRTFLNNSNGKNAQLIDPANPPVEEDAYCTAHPYDCN